MAAAQVAVGRQSVSRLGQHTQFAVIARLDRAIQ